MKHPLVSVIVPTRNSERYISDCLKSIRNQTYTNIELIVVDNSSTDKTKQIAKKFRARIFNHGPERSAQVNFGAARATGEYIYKVDSDFILERLVIAECVEKTGQGYEAIVVHNTPDASVSWIAKVRKFEVDMYKYDLTHSSARFVRKDVYKEIGGFNEKITAGEDYDFQNKLNRKGFKTGFIEAEAIHLGEPRSFWGHMRKYFVYGRDFVNYKKENKIESKEQLRFGRKVYIKHWRSFLRHPLEATGFFFYNLSKYFFGGLGYVSGLVRGN